MVGLRLVGDIGIWSDLLKSMVFAAFFSINYHCAYFLHPICSLGGFCSSICFLTFFLCTMDLLFLASF